MAKVLFVEDDPDVVEAHRTMLEARGYQVTAAGSAKEARQQLENMAPDAFILDVMMETKSAGFQLARDVHEKHPNTPIVMMTGVREKMDLPYGFEPDETWLPITTFLEKPVDPDNLVDTLDQAVQQNN